MIGLSFVRSGPDVVEARLLIESQTSRYVPIISKIEKHAALANFGAILAASDGLMVARGDLGVEMAPEPVPGSRSADRGGDSVGKPVITATQMLDSMIRNPRPTRAEATDGERRAGRQRRDHAVGRDGDGQVPAGAVGIMAKIAVEAEKLFDYEGWVGHSTAQVGQAARPQTGAGRSMRNRPSHARRIAELIPPRQQHCRRVGAAAVITLTRSGTSARLVAKCRPRGTLIAVTDDPATQRALAVTWGVQALLLDTFGDTVETLAAAEHLALEWGFYRDRMTWSSSPGIRPGPSPATSLLKVHVAGEQPAP